MHALLVAASILATATAPVPDTSLAMKVGSKSVYSFQIELPTYQCNANGTLTLEPVQEQDGGFLVKLSTDLELTATNGEKGKHAEIAAAQVDNHFKLIGSVEGQLLEVQKVISMLNTPDGAEQKNLSMHPPFKRTAKLVSEKDGVATWESVWAYTITNYTITQKIDTKAKQLLESTCVEKNYAGQLIKSKLTLKK